MSARDNPDVEADTIERPERTHLLLALGIGALVGAGIAATWLPTRRRRRRRLPGVLARPYSRVREAGGAAIDDIRSAGRGLVADFRDELSANLEAARDDFGDIARQQIVQLRKALQRERRKFLG